MPGSLRNEFFLLILIFILISCAEKETEQEISLADVPAAVLSAVQDTLPGLEITKAEIEKSGQDITYELEGKYQGREYEIEVSPTGEIIEIEEENSDKENNEQE